MSVSEDYCLLGCVF